MAEPRQKSLDIPVFLTRTVPVWQSPSWMEADRWRRVVANQPVAAICESVLIADLTDTHWEIRARDPKDEDKVADDIEAYTKILNPDMPGALSGFDIWVSMMAQDVLTIPVGGNCEVVRYRGGSPFSRQHPKGHVYKIVYIDGATLTPTFDEQFPMVQRIRGDLTNAAYFARDEIMRVVLKPRPEMERWGYGMAPPEKIYLAINLLYRGDTYYANLLLDTPEAGLLDLADMSQESATQWIQSFRELFAGIDPFKIPVLYEHEKPAQFISFGRPPTDMLFDKTTLKYAQIATAGYGLSLTDIGLGDPQKTLAGSIRDERRTRRSGFGVLKEKLRAGIDNDILPPYLEFVWKENDEEALIQKGRAFLTYAQALKAAKEAGFIKAAEGQKDLQAQGFLEGIELEEPEDPPPMPALPPGQPAANGNQQVKQEMERKPASQGGRGDLTPTKAELGPTTITAAPPETSYYDQLASVIRGAFSGVVTRMERPRLMRLIKAVTRKMLPDTAKAFIALSDAELPTWREERVKLWFGEACGFDDFPDVKKASDDVLAEIERILDLEDWWQIGDDVTPAIGLIFRLAYGEGATVAAQMVQEALYTEGLVDSPNIIGLSFDLKNPRTLAELEAKAAELVRRVNDGTRYYLKRIITSGVDEGLSSPDIARMIREGAGADDVLKQAGYSERVIDTIKAEVGGMTDYRTNSIVNTEINRAESMGRLGQWSEMGLTQKQWRHTGADDACHICRGNQDLGLVPMDYVYSDSFGGTLGPPGHPGVCHCHIEFSEDELLERAGDLRVWSGE